MRPLELFVKNHPTLQIEIFRLILESTFDFEKTRNYLRYPEFLLISYVFYIKKICLC